MNSVLKDERNVHSNKKIESIKKTLETNKIELDIVNLNIVKLEEEQTRLIDKCTASKTQHVDMNECMPIEDINISRNKCKVCDKSFKN